MNALRRAVSQQLRALGARTYASSSNPERKVAVLGAGGGIGQPLSLLMKVRRLYKVMQICEQEVGLLLVHEQCSLAGKEWVRALQCLHAVLQQFFDLSTQRSGGSGVSLLSPKSLMHRQFGVPA